jgi:hypothetical protein
VVVIVVVVVVVVVAAAAAVAATVKVHGSAKSILSHTTTHTCITIFLKMCTNLFLKFLLDL